MNILIYTLLFFHIVFCLLLTLLVLMQRPKSEGLGAAFGGGITDSLFGAGTSDVLTKMTIGLASFFFGITLLLAVLYSHRDAGKVHEALLQAEISESANAPAQVEEQQTTPSVETKPTEAEETTEPAPEA